MKVKKNPLGISYISATTAARYLGCSVTELRNLRSLTFLDSSKQQVHYSQERLNAAAQELKHIDIEPRNLWIVDNRCLVHPLSHQYDSIATFLAYEVSDTPLQERLSHVYKLLWASNYLLIPDEVKRHAFELTGIDKWQVIVCDDSPPYWRHRLALQHGFRYKEGRKEKSSNWLEIDKASGSVRKLLNLGYLRFKGFEADDMIAEVTRQASRTTWVGSSYVYTVDSDLLQLCDDEARIFWYNLQHREPKLRDEQIALEYYNRRFKCQLTDVKQIIEHKATYGDASDTLPPGVNRGFIDLANPIIRLPSIAQQLVAIALRQPSNDLALLDAVQETLLNEYGML